MRQNQSDDFPYDWTLVGLRPLRGVAASSGAPSPGPKRQTPLPLTPSIDAFYGSGLGEWTVLYVRTSRSAPPHGAGRAGDMRRAVQAAQQRVAADRHNRDLRQRHPQRIHATPA